MITSTLKQFLGKAPLLILIVAAVFVLRSASTLMESRIVFSQPPTVTAEWEIPSPDGNHIGGVIEATLRITTRPGVSLNLEEMPDVGEVMPLPSKVDPSQPPMSSSDYEHEGPRMIPEWQLEVVSRKVTEYLQDDLVITELVYGLQYLSPIDLSSPTDDKRLSASLNLMQSYQLVLSSGAVVPRSGYVSIDMADFYIVPRVDENSQPIFTLFSLTPPTNNWPYVKLIGVGLVGLATIVALRGLRLARASVRRQDQSTAVGTLSLAELYKLWCETLDYQVFIEALKQYRKGVGLKAVTWVKTTFILYSGIILEKSHVESIFTDLLKEASDEHSS